MQRHHHGRVWGLATISLAIITGIVAAQVVGGESSARRSPGALAQISPKAALDSLKDGNKRFYTGKLLPRKYPEEIGRADTAHPFAAILGCMDARTPTDLMFDRALGETFGIRVAGNVSNSDILGSLEYAVKVKKVVLIAVIGHSDCGAVKGAINKTEMGHLTGLLKKIVPAINLVPRTIQPRDTSNHKFVQMVADSNVIWTMRQIRELSPILRAEIGSGRVKLVGGMYDVKNGVVRFFGE